MNRLEGVSTVVLKVLKTKSEYEHEASMSNLVPWRDGEVVVVFSDISTSDGANVNHISCRMNGNKSSQSEMFYDLDDINGDEVSSIWSAIADAIDTATKDGLL